MCTAQRPSWQCHSVELLPQRLSCATAARCHDSTLAVSNGEAHRHSPMLRPCAIQASVVFLFLLPGLNARLRPTLAAQLRPGARVLSAEFQVSSRPDMHLVSACTCTCTCHMSHAHVTAMHMHMHV